jgi:hypothetical protein
MPTFTARVWMMAALVLLADSEAGPLKHTLLLLLHSAELLLKSARVAEVIEADGGAAGATVQMKCCCRNCLHRVSLDQLQPKLPPSSPKSSLLCCRRSRRGRAHVSQHDRVAVCR